MKALLLSALALGAADPLLAREANELSPAVAACDEQLGEFRRDGTTVYCDIDGIVYEGREELQSRTVTRRLFDGQPGQHDARRKPSRRAEEKPDGLNLPPK